MPPRPPEDIIQRLFDEVTNTLRIGIDADQGTLATEETLAGMLQWLDDRRKEVVDIAPLILAVVWAYEREHRELPGVGTTYDGQTCKMTFDNAKYHLQMVASEDVFWVDSADDVFDAQTKLTTPNQRGIILARTPMTIMMNPPVRRLDFMARVNPAVVMVTAT